MVLYKIAAYIHSVVLIIVYRIPSLGHPISIRIVGSVEEIDISV